MADLKISQLPVFTSAVPAVDAFAVVSGGTTKQITTNQVLGSGGTATLASATITGALTVDTTTLVVDAANNRVGIGTAAPVSSLQVLDGDITVTTASSFCGFNGTRQTVPSGSGNLLSRLHFSGYSTGTTYVQGASIQAFSNAAWSASSAPSYLSFQTTPSASVTLSERMKIEAAGDVTISTGNVVMATSGKGIDFAAKTPDGSGTVGSEVLSDYEEGTFTPTIVGNTIAGVGVYVNQVGTYTKIGNQVTIWVNIEWSSHTGTGTQMYIGGFPFSLRTSTGYNAYAALGYINNIALTAGNFPLILAGSSDSFARFFQSPTGGGAATAVPMDTAGQVGFSLSYQV